MAGHAEIDPAPAAPAGLRFEAQVRQAFSNLRSVLVGAGTRLERGVKVTCFVADSPKFQELNALFAEFFYFPGLATAAATAVAAFSTRGVSMSSPSDSAFRLSVMSTSTLPPADSRWEVSVSSSFVLVQVP